MTKRNADVVGWGALTVFVLLQTLWPVTVRGLARCGVVLSVDRPLLFFAVYAASYLIAMVLPMPTVLAMIGRPASLHRTCQACCVGHARPSQSVTKAVLSIAVGWAACVAADMAATVCASLYARWGLSVTASVGYLRPDGVSLILNLAVFALLPAIGEERLYRGYFLSLLRGYGDTTALWVSSILFGFMHGNLLQLPFALLTGLVLGRLTVKTERLWPAVVLHFGNNALALILSYARLFCTEEQGERLVQTVLGAVFVVGVAAGVILAVMARKRKVAVSSGCLARPTKNPVFRSLPLWLVLTASAAVTVWSAVRA